MSYSRNSTGGGAFSYVSVDQIPLLDEPTDEDFRAATGSWVYSLGSFIPNNGQDDEMWEQDPYSRTANDCSDNIDTGLESLSTSPNSIPTPSEEMMMDDEVIDIINLSQDGQIPAPSNQTSMESFNIPDPIDRGFSAYEQGPNHPQQQSTMQWTYTSSHTQGLNRPFDPSPFSPTASTFLNQPAGNEPWTLVHPRGYLLPTTDAVILDPESDPCYFAPSFGESSSPHSQEYMQSTGTLDYHGGSLSPLGTDLCAPISSMEHTSFAEHSFVCPNDHRQSPDRQMFRSDSIHGSEPDYTKVSPPPPMSFQSSFQSIYLPTVPNVSAPLVKQEFKPSHVSSPTLTSPISPHPTAVLQYQLADNPEQEAGNQNLSPSAMRPLSTKTGGRALGSHLQPDVAAEANMMRKVAACWHCVLQRDKCGPGDICDRCRKRALRPNTDYGLGCSRTSVRDLADLFLPTSITTLHKHETLKAFCARFVGKWGNTELTIHLACGRNLPALSCQVYEFAPLDQELLRSLQYVRDSETGRCSRTEKWCPPLGIQQQSTRDEQVYDRFLNKIVASHLTDLANMLYEREANDFALQLLLLMIRLKLKEKKEAKLLTDVYRLLVVTYVMNRSFVMVGNDKENILSRLKSYKPGSYPFYISPRMANRQVKFLFCHLQQKILAELLNKLQQIFHSSGKGSPRWIEAFCAVLGLAIASEEVQKCIHVLMDAKSTTGEISKEQSLLGAMETCKEIDKSFQFVMNIFRWKYSRNDNPLRDCTQDWSSKLKDPVVVQFTRDLVLLITDRLDYLQERQYVDISEENQGKYTSRLVSRFLLHFWNPT